MDRSQTSFLTLAAVALSLLTAVAAGGGFFFEGVYEDEKPSMTIQAQAQDAVNLFLVAPALLLLSRYVRTGTTRALLLLAGTSFYLLYTYLQYSTATPVNPLFLVYVATWSLALWTMVYCLMYLPAGDVAERFAVIPRRAIAVYMIFAGGGLAFVWLKEAVMMLITGTPTPLLQDQATPALVIQAMDLGLIVPMALGGGILLLRKKPLGYLLSGMMLVKVATLLVAVWAMALMLYLRGQADSLMPVVTIGVMVAIGLYLGWTFFTARRDGSSQSDEGERSRLQAY